LKVTSKFISLLKNQPTAASELDILELFIERQNGTDRNWNSREVRKTLCFSK